jgi:hypothetical protein
MIQQLLGHKVVRTTTIDTQMLRGDRGVRIPFDTWVDRVPLQPNPAFPRPKRCNPWDPKGIQMLPLGR